MEGGIITGCSMGMTAEFGTSLRAKGVTMQDLVLGIATRGWAMGSAAIEECRILRSRRGIVLSAVDAIVVRGCVLDVDDVAIELNGSLPEGWGTPRTSALVSQNEVRRATVGFVGTDLAQCDVEKNDFRAIDHIGFRLDCPARLEGNRFEGTKRPADYAPPRYAPCWNLGTVGVLYGTTRRSDKPTLVRNSFRGCSKHAIALVGGAVATMAENEFEEGTALAVGRCDINPEDGEQAWGRARALWEQRYPEERQRR